MWSINFEGGFLSVWKYTILLLLFLVITPLTIGASLYSLLALDKINHEPTAVFQLPMALEIPTSGIKTFSSSAINEPVISSLSTAGDARPEIIRQYLTTYNSPILPFADFIVEIADKYGVDFRLVTAIAQQESNLCKKIPEGTFNCWGWGIHSRGTLGFRSYEEGVETVTLGIKEEYLDKGYNTVEKIMSKYTPHSNGSWANGVNQFMLEME